MRLAGGIPTLRRMISTVSHRSYAILDRAPAPGIGASETTPSTAPARGRTLLARGVELSLLGGHLPNNQGAFFDLLTNVLKLLRALLLVTLLL
jgi:hypothetical protein